MTPAQFSDFVGPDRVKARLELAATAAKQRGEPLGHVLLLGPPGAGQSALARIIASTLGVGVKCISGPGIENEGDLARLVTSLKKSDVLIGDHILDGSQGYYQALKKLN